MLLDRLAREQFFWIWKCIQSNMIVRNFFINEIKDSQKSLQYLTHFSIGQSMFSSSKFCDPSLEQFPKLLQSCKL